MTKMYIILEILVMYNRLFYSMPYFFFQSM